MHQKNKMDAAVVMMMMMGFLLFSSAAVELVNAAE
jgi:hypothetical protein